MKKRYCERWMIIQIALSLNIAGAQASYTYDYTSGAITLEDSTQFSHSTGVLHRLQEVSDGQTITASITLDAQLAFGSTTHISASSDVHAELSGSPIAFFTDPANFAIPGLTASPFSPRTVSGVLTTDANGTIVDWDLRFGFWDIIPIGSFNIDSNPTDNRIFPLTLNGESINSSSNLSFHLENRVPYSFQSYDSISQSNDDSIDRVQITHHTSEKGQWAITTGPETTVDAPETLWLMGVGLLGFIGHCKRKSGYKV